MQSLTRKPTVKPSALSQLALAEEQAWQVELATRKTIRPLPLKPAWA